MQRTIVLEIFHHVNMYLHGMRPTYTMEAVQVTKVSMKMGRCNSSSSILAATQFPFVYFTADSGNL
ncbi:hypothetical protein LK494_04335 [Anaerovorax odorimutans]|nr:hypothetical protein [Anaerovorax odorimutans]